MNDAFDCLMNTGLHDSKGVEIRIGDYVKIPVTGNRDFHGEWSIYEVQLRGITPILSYICSEKGKVLPIGYGRSALSDYYDSKQFLFATDIAEIRPSETEIEVVPHWKDKC